MNENNEELIFKGMRQLRYKRQDDMLRDALRSPYYWWWAFLRLSKDYWWVCQRRGAVGDLRLKGMYRDFGNVYELTFEEWFLRRGKNLLSEEPSTSPTSRALTVFSTRSKPARSR